MFWTPGTGYESVQYKNLLLGYTVKSWNKLYAQCRHQKAEIVKFLLLQKYLWKRTLPPDHVFVTNED